MNNSGKSFTKLPESELEVMQAIWALYAEDEQFISAGLIMKRFPDLCRLKLTTVLTLITRLQSKGFISSEKLNRANCYRPLIPVEKYRKYAMEDFLKRVYCNKRKDLIIALLDTEEMSEEDIAELKTIVDARLEIAKR